MKYELTIKHSVQKSLARIVQPYQNRIIDAIYELGNNPRPIGAKKLSGRPAWRIRVGNYRIIYEIHDNQLIIVVLAIGHRREIYRK